MNSKLQDILNHIKKKFGRAEAEEDSDSSNDQIKKDIDPGTPEAQKSLVKGDHGTIFGLSRPIVIGGGVLILLGVLCLAKDEKDDEAGEAEAAPVRAGE